MPSTTQTPNCDLKGAFKHSAISLFLPTLFSTSNSFWALVWLSSAVNAKYTHKVQRRGPQSFNNCTCSVLVNSFCGQYGTLNTLYFNYVKLCVMIIDSIEARPLKGKYVGTMVKDWNIPSWNRYGYREVKKKCKLAVLEVAVVVAVAAAAAAAEVAAVADAAAAAAAAEVYTSSSSRRMTSFKEFITQTYLTLDPFSRWRTLSWLCCLVFPHILEWRCYLKGQKKHVLELLEKMSHTQGDREVQCHFHQ